MHAHFGRTTASPLDLPRHPRELAAHYDLTTGGAGPGRFDHLLAEAADTYGLSCAALTPAIASAAAERLAAGDLSVGLHLDRGTDWREGDPLARLAFAVQDAGGHAVNPPARARAFTDRAALHHDLERRGLGVLPAVILRPWARPALDGRQRWCLRLDEPGARLEILPAGRGEPIRVPRPTTGNAQAAVELARERHPGETLVLRPEVRPPWLRCADNHCRPAHWRVLSCLGEVTAFWWQPDGYRQVTPEEIESHGLGPLFRYTQALADLSGLEWFSAELLLCPHPRAGEFTIPDVAGLDLPLAACGLEDAGDLEALPEPFVRRLALRIAELGWRVRRGEGGVRRAG